MMYIIISCSISLFFYIFLRYRTYQIIGKKIALQEVEITRNVLAINLYTKNNLQKNYPEMYALLYALATNIDVDSETFIESVSIVRERGSAGINSEEMAHQRALQRELMLLLNTDESFFNEYYDFHLSVFKAKKPLRFIIVKFRMVLFILGELFQKIVSEEGLTRFKGSCYPKKASQGMRKLIDEKVREDMLTNRTSDMLIRI